MHYKKKKKPVILHIKDTVRCCGKGWELEMIMGIYILKTINCSRKTILSSVNYISVVMVGSIQVVFFCPCSPEVTRK